MDGRPIGVFDSGVGGLTVVREIFRKLPDEPVIYFGDTARTPYGPKSPEVVKTYALENSAFLARKGVKMIVVACNTASSVALNDIRMSFDLPVIGVIEPGAKAAVRRTRGRIGVIGTVGTILSASYDRAISSMNPEVEIYKQPCPLFVALAEEGWTEGEIPTLVAERYLGPLKDKGVDTLVLGCTHYLLLKGVISSVMGPDVALADSAEETAIEVSHKLSSMGLRAPGGFKPEHIFYLSDIPHKFEEIGRRFLGMPIGEVRRVRYGRRGWEDEL